MECYALFCGRTLKPDTPDFSTTSIFVNTAMGMEGSVLRNVLDAVVDNLKYVLFGFWTGRWHFNSSVFLLKPQIFW
jgi:hypothetical protein